MADDSLDLHRRAVLRASLLAVAAAALPGCRPDAPPPGPDAPATARGIDVHCHVFNARDLPIPGFVINVVLEGVPFADAQFGMLVTLISLVMRFGTSGADAEYAALEDGGEAPSLVGAADARPAASDEAMRAHVRAAALAMLSPAPDPIAVGVIEEVQKVLAMSEVGLTSPAARFTGAISQPGGAAPDSLARTTAFLDQVAGLRPGEAPPGVPRARPALGPAQPGSVAPVRSSEALADAVANGFIRGAANRHGITYMASLLTSYRGDLVRYLAALPGEVDASSVALFTPSMIDFSFWLDSSAGNALDPTPTVPPRGVESLDAQIKVMSRIALGRTTRGGGGKRQAVHPFVSFCPWREAAEQQGGQPRQFNTLKKAIAKEGFIGVKLYPVVGFRPIDNDPAEERLYPPRLRQLDGWAKGLNDALEALYAWCESNEVPIMAHCSFSQYTDPATGKFGAPSGWWRVLDKHRDLRLNLAHCGGVWDLGAGRAAVVSEDVGGDPWPIEVVKKLGSGEFEHLYADLADYSDVLHCYKKLVPAPARCPPAFDTSSLVTLAELVACNPGSRERLMYGTDFMFLAKEAANERYLSSMRDCLAPMLGVDPAAKLMGGNAARFLGLTDPQGLTRKRLDAFRGDDFLARWEEHA